MGLGSGIRKKPVPDPGSRGQKAPDPGSGSATLLNGRPVSLRQPSIRWPVTRFSINCSLHYYLHMLELKESQNSRNQGFLPIFA
jgi:hypothetical protein